MSFFKKIWKGIKSLFTKKKIAEAVHTGIDVVERLKEALDSPLTPLFTSLIPGNVDDAVCAQLKYWLPQILVELRLGDELLRSRGADALVQYAVQHLRMLSKELRDKKFLEIAAMISRALTAGSDGGNAITYEEFKAIVKAVYNAEYKTQHQQND